jgi:hypothetical protein
MKIMKTIFSLLQNPLGKARATHGDNNGLRQILLHSGKVKSLIPLELWKMK